MRLDNCSISVARASESINSALGAIKEKNPRTKEIIGDINRDLENMRKSCDMDSAVYIQMAQLIGGAEKQFDKHPDWSWENLVKAKDILHTSVGI